LSDHEKTRPVEDGLFLVVSAPSGTGKTSICRQVLKLCPGLRFSVSFTTRQPRPGEVDGRDYHFISDDVFRQKAARGEFVEWAENYGHFYGTAEETIKASLGQGVDLMLDLEPRGAKAMKEKYPGGIFVFILPPTLAELKARLNRRGFEKPDVIQTRFNKALDEIKEVFWYDYVIFNDKIKEAIDQMRSIYIAEKSRRQRLCVRLQVFLEKKIGDFSKRDIVYGRIE
jgi:guanylate kinase